MYAVERSVMENLLGKATRACPKIGKKATRTARIVLESLRFVEGRKLRCTTADGRRGCRRSASAGRCSCG
jgi:hypothetical protein